MRGLSLVELIAVLLVTGILAATAIPRFFNRATFDARAFSDQAKSMVRHAQRVAIAQNRPVSVRLDGASIALCYGTGSACVTANAGTLVPNPAGGANSGSDTTRAACADAGNYIGNWACEAPPAGVTSTTTPSTAYFYFDALGKPFASGDDATGLTSTFPSSGLTINVSGNGESHGITIEQETGYVH